ncbi:MAG: ABC transporter, partial [Actinomycetota bacterium]
MRASKMVMREVLVFKRTWVQSLFFSFLQPTMFLTAMGLGLGSLINRSGSDLGVPYVHFLAPGILASTCMQTAAFATSYPILMKIIWQRNYEAIMATPLRVIDILFGEVGAVALRLSMVASAFLLVMFAFGIATSPLALAALPAAVLVGLAF